MGTALSGDSELIRITLIDYFSRAVLVNNIVEPDVPMQHLNTRFSGVSWGDVRKAKREGNCLKGKAGARRALWRYVGQKTVVVGHGASNDLRALRWIHGLVVDSFVTEFNTMKRKEAKNADKKDIRTDNASEGEVRVADPIKGGSLPRKDRNGGTPAIHLSGKVPNGYGNETATKMQKKTKKGGSDLSLKNLVKKRLDRDIQMGGKVGHDSLEDAIAARDLIDWIITNANQE
jgi:DNA polymerase III epsilon subunit-like protein